MGQPLLAVHMYTRQKPTSAAALSIDPTADVAANAAPCSSVRKIETGADVKGNPTSHPANDGPNRRPSSDAATTIAGVRVSLRRTAVRVV